jgi:hypothetical protein
MKLKQKCLVEGCQANSSGALSYCRAHRDSSPIRRYQHIKRTASTRGMSCNLSFKHFSELISDNTCYYCSGPMTGTGGGLDRLDSSKGYTKGNVVPCCLQCNVVKSNLLTANEMKLVAKLLKRVRNKTRIWFGANPQKRRKKHGISKRRRKK